MANKTKIVYKLGVFGPPGAGKSSLIRRALYNTFAANYSMTIGFDFQNLDMIINDKVYSLNFWDFAGQERFKIMLGSQLIGTKGVFLVFPKNGGEKEFNSMNSFYELVQDNLDKKVPIALIGTKYDLPEYTVMDKKLEDYIIEKNLISDKGKPFWTSAKTSTGIYPNKGFAGLNELLLAIEFNNSNPLKTSDYSAKNDDTKADMD